jgi:hypothetical protein
MRHFPIELKSRERGTILAAVAQADCRESVVALKAGDYLQLRRVKNWVNRAYVLLGASDEDTN